MCKDNLNKRVLSGPLYAKHKLLERARMDNGIVTLVYTILRESQPVLYGERFHEEGLSQILHEFELQAFYFSDWNRLPDQLINPNQLINMRFITVLICIALVATLAVASKTRPSKQENSLYTIKYLLGQKRTHTLPPVREYHLHRKNGRNTKVESKSDLSLSKVVDCPFCEWVVSSIRKYPSNVALDKIEHICGRVGVKCFKIASKVAEFLESENPPKNICAALHFCPNF